MITYLKFSSILPKLFEYWFWVWILRTVNEINIWKYRSLLDITKMILCTQYCYNNMKMYLPLEKKLLFIFWDLENFESGRCFSNETSNTPLLSISIYFHLSKWKIYVLCHIFVMLSAGCFYISFLFDITFLQMLHMCKYRTWYYILP